MSAPIPVSRDLALMQLDLDLSYARQRLQRAVHAESKARHAVELREKERAVYVVTGKTPTRKRFIREVEGYKARLAPRRPTPTRKAPVIPVETLPDRIGGTKATARVEALLALAPARAKKGQAS